MTALLASLDTHALDLVLVLAGLAVACAAPLVVPYMAAIAIGIQSTAPHSLTSDGDILCGLVAGLLLGRFCGRRPDLHLRNMALVALGCLCVAVLVSYLAHLGTGSAHDIRLASEFIVSRSLLIAVLVVLLGFDRPTTARWLRAVGVLALVLATGRLAEGAGLPLAGWLAQAHVVLLGDYGDVGSWNTLAVVLAVGVPSALGGAFLSTRSIGDYLALSAALLIVLALSTTASRTGAVVVLLTAAALIVATRSRARRIAVGAIVAVFVLGSLNPGLGVLRKPVLVQTAGLADNRVSTELQPTTIPADNTTPQGPGGPPTPTPPPRAALPPLVPDWRSTLDRTYYRLEDQIPAGSVYPTGNRIEFVARRGGLTGDVRLVLSVNGHEIVHLRPDQLSPYYAWVEVGIPDAVLSSDGANVIEFDVMGQSDSTASFFSVGGVNARADGYVGRLWSGNSWLTQDLSSDPGLQQGTLLVFVNGQIPTLARFEPQRGTVIDPSIGDRFYLWQTALRIFEGNLATGTGFYTFGSVKTQYQPDAAVFESYSNAHSNYLELLADLGLQGMLAFALLLVAPTALLARRLLACPRPWAEVALATGMADFAVSSITQTWVADSRVYLLCWALALLTGAAAASGRTERAPAPSAAATAPRAAADGHVVSV